MKKITLSFSLCITLLTNLALSTATPEIRTHARFVPERMDDFAWENDRIAMRAYGPALRAKTENNGFDPWLKRVDYPIVDKWYQQNAEGKSYHEDHGEGLDNYKVNDSAGVGGTGLWIDGERRALETFTAYEIIETTPERSCFKLIYENTIDGHLFREEKTITIELGRQLFDVASTFYKDGELASNLPVCIGLSLQNGKPKTFKNKAGGWIATWGSHDKSELGTAVTMPPENVKDIQVLSSKKKSQDHVLIIANTDTEGKIQYSTGFAWKKARIIESADAWLAYLSKQ